MPYSSLEVDELGKVTVDGGHESARRDRTRGLAIGYLLHRNVLDQHRVAEVETLVRIGERRAGSCRRRV